MASTQLENDLQTYFGHPSFRTGQKAIIEDVLDGKSVLGILPTGSGKSICYQLPAKRLDGLTIVVSPLISLMTDQVKQLKAQHYKEVVAINSFLTPDKRRVVLNQLDAYKLIYISPELLQNASVVSQINRHKISLFVIDEAHCISQWGHEFRPDYLKLSTIVEYVGNPPVLALSATAPIQVQGDIVSALNKPHMHKHVYPMDRENIAFIVKTVSDRRQKLDILTELLSDHPGPTVIYFSSRQLTEHIAQTLSQRRPERRIAYYHGGMDQTDRLLIQQQFMNDQLDVICCTSAFGMGIDKSDIRLVVHYHLPVQIESYIQEVGRAGRDGQESAAVLLYCAQDYSLAESLLIRELPDTRNLDLILHVLQSMAGENGTLPALETILKETELNETQWRFLKAQLEKHDIIMGNTINTEKTSWHEAIMAIQSHIGQRLHFKQSKLQQMINWIEADDCLRKNLYKDFQNGYTIKSDNCCSNCGYSLKTSERIPAPQDQFNTWQSKLRFVLLQE